MLHFDIYLSYTCIITNNKMSLWFYLHDFIWWLIAIETLNVVSLQIIPESYHINVWYLNIQMITYRVTLNRNVKKKKQFLWNYTFNRMATKYINYIVLSSYIKMHYGNIMMYRAYLINFFFCDTWLLWWNGSHKWMHFWRFCT